ncbi:GspH/FimT family pseudopilin [Moritella sp. Urea-trap-13]|uniref:GspH/FimT family pseudopilin n=1 Tax=Moritella sp. Urea-trap-13 TaxID=2058327 RepID=UPI000C337D17|nr:GspH/FimT family pseudopilin [Moritella sp. Urea-trap-13]PKH08011.1 prepilin-type cleavage/methylation domain-containing protein [Moritella sp. Urea-trap-13]
MNKSVGFTLIELMITISIFAILIGIGVPSYQKTVQQSRMDDATTLINNALSYAKNTAIAHNRTLYMATAGTVLTLTTSDADVVNKTTITTDSNSTLSFIAPGVPMIIFRANGTVAAGNIIRYCSGDSGIEVVVGINGDPVITSVSC